LDELNDPTYSWVDTPASLLAQQENDKANKTHGIYGPSVSEPYAFFDPDTHCLRTCEATLVSGSPEYSQTLPASGSMQNGKLFQQLRLVHHTKETGYLLWPTPTTQESEHPQAEWNDKGRLVARNGNTHSMNLADAVQKWPTPRVTGSGEDIAVIQQRFKNGLKYSHRLEEAVALWPTPQANSWGATGHRNQLQKQVDNGTITAEEKAAMSSGNGGKLNPMWVEWLMGWPLGWTDLKPLEMDKSLSVQQQLGES
jgi:hypothetical protein